MLMKITKKVKIIQNNILHKTIFTSIFSVVTTLAFAAYNTYLGIKFAHPFAISISIYYILLVWIKLATLIVENKIFKQESQIQTRSRLKNYQILSMFIFLIDLCLIAPIIIMVTNPNKVNFGIIPAITMATYSLYKIVFAIINYVKSKKSQNLTIILIKEINIIDAIVSILTLQHTLIMVNGGMNKPMQTLSFVSSVGFIVLIITFSILSYLKNKKG